MNWNKHFFFAQHDAALIKPVDEIIAQNELSEHPKALQALVKRAIGFKYSREEVYPVTGNHRFGGIPRPASGY